MSSRADEAVIRSKKMIWQKGACLPDSVVLVLAQVHVVGLDLLRASVAVLILVGRADFALAQ